MCFWFFGGFVFSLLIFFGVGVGEWGCIVCLYHMQRTLYYYGLTFVNNGFVFAIYYIEDFFVSSQKSTELDSYIE